MAKVKITSSYPEAKRRGLPRDWCDVPPGASEVDERQYAAYLAGDPGVKRVGAGETPALPVKPAGETPAVPVEVAAGETPALPAGKRAKKAKE